MGIAANVPATSAAAGSPAAGTHPWPRDSGAGPAGPAAPQPWQQFVAADGTSPPQEAAGAHRHAERRLIEERMHDAALRATLGALPMWGLCLAASIAPVAAALWPQVPYGAVAWTILAAGVSALLWWLPQRTRHRSGPLDATNPTRQRIQALTALGGVTAASAPWLAVGPGDVSVIAQALLTVAATAVGLAGVVCLAPMPRLAVGSGLLPLSPMLAAMATGNWATHRALALLGGFAACAIGAAVLRLRNRTWRQNTRALIEQGARLRALEAERDAAWQADQDKSRFLAIASHDLRQPVHALGLFAATLQRRLKDTPDEPLARNMMRAIDGLERSFSAMLDISRLDAGAMQPKLQTFPLRDMFRRMHMHYAGQAELSGLGLRFSPGGKRVTTDPQLLERIVGNLIQNAIKYTEHGGIVVVARSTARYINIEIWDTGLGISPDLLPRIFEEFYQVGRGERDRTRGLGMGLAIVKRLATLLDIRLVVNSRPGKGTLFRVGVPIGQLPGIQEDMAPADTVPMQATAPRMVLVIDDEEPIREGLRLLLEEWGYQAMTAADAAQAEHATKALEGHVDLVLSDLHLGDGPDGIEAIAAVRRLCGHDVAAILITGDTSHDEIQRITASGHQMLFKPVQPRRLYDALKGTLG